MDMIAEIRRLHFVENETVSALAKMFKLSRPTIRKHLKTIEEPVYSTRQHQPHPKLGTYLDQLQTWLENDAALPGKRRRTAQRLYECLQVEGYLGGYTAVQRYVKDWKRASSQQSDHQAGFRAASFSTRRDLSI
jgi:transposase